MFDTLARYVLKQAAARFLLLFLIFLGVLVGGQVGILIGQGVPPEACLPLVEKLVQFSLPIALPLALATAILVIIGGMNQDGELRALAASGVSHRAVVVRLLPLVGVAVLACLVLTNLVMPQAVASIRASKGRLAQTLIAQRVASDEPIIEEHGISVWVGSAEGAKLHNVRALMRREGEFVAAFSPDAHWALSDQGIHLEFEDVQLLQRRADGHIVAVSTSAYDYLWEGDSKAPGQSEPDAMSTAEAFRLASAPPPAGKDPAPFNNARLTVHFRFFLPLSLVAFSLFAIGLGLTFGTSQNLPGVVMVVVTVALVIYPAFGYVKTNVHQAQMNPGWLLWPPAGVVALAGLWLLWRPDRAREQLAWPFLALADLVRRKR